MATRLKTVQYAFPTLATMDNSVTTNLSTITIYLPESTKTFVDVWLEVSLDSAATANANLSTKTVNLRLGAASYTSTTNANTLTGSSENYSYFDTRDFTAHFVSNWSGSSMTCDVQMLFTESATTGWKNVTAILNITYEYDDTASTQVKTVCMPLNAPTGELPTAKTSHDDIPELRTYLPEAGKTFRNIFIVAQAGTGTASTVDFNVSYEISSLGVQTTSDYESALNTDRWTRYVYEITTLLTTDTTHTFNMWANLAGRYHSPQVWMVITYEFDASVTSTTLDGAIDDTTTTVNVVNAANIGGTGARYVIQVDDEEMLVTAASSNTLTVERGYNSTTAVSHDNGSDVYPMVMNSLLIPMEIDSPMGGISSENFQRGERDLWIQELSPKIKRLAIFVNFSATATVAGLNARIGDGSFVTYTDGGSSVIAGSCGLMIRNDSPSGITIARGRSNLFMDIYNTSTVIRGGGINGQWSINYTSLLNPAGHGAHNHTVKHLIHTHGTGVAAQDVITVANALSIPETNYFITAFGLHLEYVNNSTLISCMPSILAERLVAEGGLIWERCYSDSGVNDAEVGNNVTFGQVRSLFNRWNGDTDTKRLPIETNRRYRINISSSTSTVAFIHKMTLDVNYHSITYSISGTIKGSSGGSVTIDLHRQSNGEKVLSTTISGNGSFSFDWYDDTEELFIIARETLIGGKVIRGGSDTFLAPESNIDIALRTLMPIDAGFYGS